jgi:hypothetical protein
VTYRLEPDSPTLEMDAPTALVVPLSGAVSIGATLEREDGADAVLAGKALVEDLGGWVRLAGPISVGTRDEVTASRFSNAIEVAGKSDGTWIVAELDGDPVLRLPVTEGAYAGLVPSGSMLHAEMAGREDSAAASGGDLFVGDAGALALTVANSDGTPVPALVRLSDGRVFSALPGGADLLTGPYEGAAEIYLGPAYERVTVDLTIAGLTTASVTADPVVTDAVLCDFATLVARSLGARGSRSASRLAGAHVDYAVSSATASRRSPSTIHRGVALRRSGSRTAGPQGQPRRGPTPRARSSAHGAARTDHLDAGIPRARSQRDALGVCRCHLGGEMSGLPRLWDPWPSDSGSTGPRTSRRTRACSTDGWRSAPSVRSRGSTAWRIGARRESSERCSRGGARRRMVRASG